MAHKNSFLLEGYRQAFQMRGIRFEPVFFSDGRDGESADFSDGSALSAVKVDDIYDSAAQEKIYLALADALALKPILPSSYEAVYHAFHENSEKKKSFSLHLPKFADENDYIVYTPAFDTYQYGFYNYAMLKSETPIKVYPTGSLLIRKDIKKERPRMLVSGDSSACLLVPYLAHHFDLMLSAPISASLHLPLALAEYKPSVIILIAHKDFAASPLFYRALACL